MLNERIKGDDIEFGCDESFEEKGERWKKQDLKCVKVRITLHSSMALKGLVKRGLSFYQYAFNDSLRPLEGGDAVRMSPAFFTSRSVIRHWNKLLHRGSQCGNDPLFWNQNRTLTPSKTESTAVYIVRGLRSELSGLVF